MFPGIATLTAIFATMSWLIGVFMIFTFFLITYLIDRALYIIGWLIPFDFKFDFDLYGRAHSTDSDVATLYQLTKSTQAFDRFYRIATEVLTQKEL